MNKVYLVINESGFDPEDWQVPLASVISSAHATAEGAAAECDRLRADRAAKENERIDKNNKLVGTGQLWIDMVYKHVTPDTYAHSIYVEERELLT